MRIEYGHWMIILALIAWHIVSGLLDNLTEFHRRELAYYLGYAEAQAGLPRKYMREESENPTNQPTKQP